MGFDPTNELGRGKSEIVERLLDRRSFVEIDEFEFTIRIHDNDGLVDRAEEVVEVAQHILVCTDQEHADLIRLTVFDRVKFDVAGRFAVPDETLDLAVRVTRDVTNRCRTTAWLTDALNRAHGE